MRAATRCSAAAARGASSPPKLIPMRAIGWGPRPGVKSQSTAGVMTASQSGRKSNFWSRRALPCPGRQRRARGSHVGGRGAAGEVQFFLGAVEASVEEKDRPGTVRFPPLGFAVPRSAGIHQPGSVVSRRETSPASARDHQLRGGSEAVDRELSYFANFGSFDESTRR